MYKNKLNNSINSLSSLNSSSNLSKSLDSSSSLNSIEKLSKSYDSVNELSSYLKEYKNGKEKENKKNLEKKINNFVSIDKKIKREREKTINDDSSPQINDALKIILNNSVSPSFGLNLNNDYYNNFK